MRRKVRDASVVAGYGRPKYAKPSAPKTYKWNGKAPTGAVVLNNGDKRNSVKDLQSALNKANNARLVVDGDFGDKTEKALRAFQRKAKITVDGEYGKQSARALQKALDGMK